MNQDDVQLIWIQAWVVGQNTAGEVVKRTGQLDSGKSAAGNHEAEEGRPLRSIGLAVGPLEHLNHVIADANGIQQAFEVEGQLLDVGHSQIIRNRAKRQHQVVVWKYQLPCRGIRGQDHFAVLQINRVDPPADEFRAAEAAAQGRADVAGLQGTSSHFR